MVRYTVSHMTSDTIAAGAPVPSTPTTSKGLLWTGRILSAIPVLLMGVLGLFIYFFAPDQTKQMDKYGYPPHAMTPIFIVELLCVILYVIPQTAVLGAILLTGYLGGAVSTHVRASEPFWFPLLIGGIVWLGLLFRDARLRELLPFRKTT